MMTSEPNHADEAPLSWPRAKPPGTPSRFGTAGTFSAGLGRHIGADSPRGYYIDLRSKAISSRWPPPWYEPGTPRLHVVIIQWGLGCHERYLGGEGEEWLAAARWVGDHLLDMQERDGKQDGGWVQRFTYRHTYRVVPPWLSGMAQGQGASLLVRLHRETGEERYAEAAMRALRPMRIPPRSGGVAGALNGGFIPQEFPTDPPSHVLNGAMFGLWGCYDVAAGLDDPVARTLADAGFATLAAALPRYDIGHWSRYDLFPHPVVNVATPMYHKLHIDQLRAMSMLNPDPRFAETAEQFERYASSRLNLVRAYARKVVFRVAVPRNQRLARIVPWGP